MFRELLQNSDDAFSKTVEIRFETERYIDRNDTSKDQTSPPLDGRLPDLKTALVCDFHILSCVFDLINLFQVHRWLFKNDGILFRDEDWNRLKKIGMRGPNAGLLHWLTS